MPEPFLKWAGGKRWLTNSKQLPQPETFTRYVEPFLGGGAVFFSLRPASGLLSDINAELIELYCVIRDHPDALMQEMLAHHAAHTSEYYYKVRASVSENIVSRAARTLYLNRTCWNGLYRVNLKGRFNVPIGTKTSVVFDWDDFVGVSELLHNCEIRCSDFETVIADTREGDFLFVDPPYTVQHNANGFIKYNETLFSWADQVRLRDAISGAADRGVAVVITNADHKSVRDLYAEICDYRTISRSSVLAGSSKYRGQTSEALFSVNIAE